MVLPKYSSQETELYFGNLLNHVVHDAVIAFLCIFTQVNRLKGLHTHWSITSIIDMNMVLPKYTAPEKTKNATGTAQLWYCSSKETTVFR